jgi:hypothetical protein
MLGGSWKQLRATGFGLVGLRGWRAYRLRVRHATVPRHHCCGS